jgi:hypothetical protein
VPQPRDLARGSSTLVAAVSGILGFFGIVLRCACCDRSATTGNPFFDPLRSISRREGIFAFGPHPHERERVLTRELAAWPGTFIDRVQLRDDDTVGVRTGILAFALDQPAAVRCQLRPASWLQQLSRRIDRRLVRSVGFNLVEGKRHSSNIILASRPDETRLEGTSAQTTSVETIGGIASRVPILCP